MHFVKGNAKDFKKVYFSYLRDFKWNERANYFRMKNLLQHGYCELLLLSNHNKIIGYALMIQVSDYNYLLLNYFAIVKRYRKQGYGHIFLDEIKKYYHDTNGIFGEIEALGYGKNERENQIRKQRLHFYKTLGFEQLSNIRLKLWDVEYNAIFLPIQDQEKKQLQKYLLNIYENLYNKAYHSQTNVQKRIICEDRVDI